MGKAILAIGCAGAILVSMAAVGMAQAADCHRAALDVLREAAPGGYGIYQQIKDKRFFRNWIDCGDSQFSLPTAVHESVHYITGEIDAYPLVGGGQVKRPEDDPTLFRPAKIAHRFKRGSLFVSTYLRPGGASSSSEFRYLLDEMNAYTHDLDTALRLMGRQRDGERTSHRDGLAATMAFVALYVQTAEETEPTTWKGLHKPEMSAAIKQIWTHAEAAMTSSCRVRDIGHEDKGFLRQLCEAKPQASLGRLLGRPAICPTACLEPEPKTASAQ